VQLDTLRRRYLEYSVYVPAWTPLGGICLPEVRITNSDNFEQALRKFNKLVQQTGILAEARRREHYEPPSVRRKKKAAAKRRKSMKNAQRGT